MSEDYVSIFWDYENCEIPSTSDAFAIVDGIQRLAHQYGAIKLFKAYFSVSETISARTIAIRTDLVSCGVSLIDCPHLGKKDVADKIMIVDMLTHVLDGSSPPTVIVISGDGDFVYAVSTLRFRQCRVVVISPENATHMYMRARASEFYEWPRHILGQELPSGTSERNFELQPIGGSIAGLQTPSRISRTAALGKQRPTFASIASAPAPNQMSALTSPACIVKRIARKRSQSESYPPTQKYSPSVSPVVSKGLQLNLTNDSSSSVAQDAYRQPKNGVLCPPSASTSTFPSSSGSQSTFSPIVAPRNAEEYRPADVTSGPTSGEPALSGNEPGKSEEQLQLQTVFVEEPDGLGSPVKIIGGSEAHRNLNMKSSTGDTLVQEVHPASLDFNYITSDGSAQTFTATDASVAASGSAEETSDPSEGLIPVMVRPDIVVPIFTMTRLREPPYPYRPLVAVLEQQRLLGNTRVVSSLLGSLLRQEDPRVYKNAGVTQLKDYITEAAKANVIILGNPDFANGNRWVSLHPTYHGAKRSAAQASSAL